MQLMTISPKRNFAYELHNFRFKFRYAIFFWNRRFQLTQKYDAKTDYLKFWRQRMGNFLTVRHTSACYGLFNGMKSKK